jgi:hypothetical protein
MPLDSSDIDAALVMKLSSDATLLALCPNGVYVDEAPPGSTRFVIVSLIDEVDQLMFGGRAFENGLYSIEARMLSTVAGANPKAAAARIDVLIDPQPPLPPATLAVPGYSLMTTHRESRIRMTEVDDLDRSIRWFRRGGQYRVMVSPT